MSLNMVEHMETPSHHQTRCARNSKSCGNRPSLTDVKQHAKDSAQVHRLDRDLIGLYSTTSLPHQSLNPESRGNRKHNVWHTTLTRAACRGDELCRAWPL